MCASKRAGGRSPMWARRFVAGFSLLLVLGLSVGCTVVGFDTPYNKGVDAYNAGNLPEAAEHFRQATRAKPEFYEAWYNLARVYDELARSRSKLAAQREADRQRDAAARASGVAAESDDAPGTAGTGDDASGSLSATPAELRELARQDGEKAAAAYRRCLEIQPKAARALVSFAMFRYEQGETSEALELLEQAVAAQSDRAWPLAALGLYYQRQGRRDEAFNAYRRALAKEPGDGLTHFRLGTWYEDGGDLTNARTHYEAAVDAAPEDPLYWRHLGYLYREVDEPIRAAGALETSLEYDPGGEATRSDRIRVLLDIARAYGSAGWHERAVYSLWRARDLRADDAVVAAMLLESYRALDRQEMARLIEAGASAPPDSGASDAGADDPDGSGTDTDGADSRVSPSGGN